MTERDRWDGGDRPLAPVSDSITVWYPCKYVPAELLAGFGAGCSPLTPEPDSFEAADELAHPNLCGFGKAVLARALDPDVNALVLTTCCDVMRRVYDVLEREHAVDFLWLIDLPHKRGLREVARFRVELERLAEAFGAWSGREFDYERACASIVPPVERVEPRVALVGAHAPASLVESCERTLSLPLQNLTCTAPRTLAAKRPPQSHQCCNDAKGTAPVVSFLDWYAPVLLNQTPCMRMHEVGERKSLAQAPGVEGVVYHTMKFCDYYGFEYLDAAKRGDTPMLKVETDGTRASSGQLKTRIQAFDETLRGRSHGNKTQALRGDKPVYVLGLDSGSTSTDAVVLDGAGKVVASSIVPTGAKASAGAARAIEEALGKAGLSDSDLALRVATGYGRDSVPGMDLTVTEITCHARGAHALAPEARTVVDIGGQDSKVIHLATDGSVENFVMNDKCAAGTGRFLEATARALELSLLDFCKAGLEWKHRVAISSMCTVFAESEVVSLVADDTPLPDIVHGLDVAVATKTAALVKRVNAEPPYLMTGGVAANEGVVRALEEALGAPVATHEDSQLCGAIGAALIGLDAANGPEA